MRFKCISALPSHFYSPYCHYCTHARCTYTLYVSFQCSEQRKSVWLIVQGPRDDSLRETLHVCRASADAHAVSIFTISDLTFFNPRPPYSVFHTNCESACTCAQLDSNVFQPLFFLLCATRADVWRKPPGWFKCCVTGAATSSTCSDIRSMLVRCAVTYPPSMCHCATFSALLRLRAHFLWVLLAILWKQERLRTKLWKIRKK